MVQPGVPTYSTAQDAKQTTAITTSYPEAATLTRGSPSEATTLKNV